MTSLYSTSGYVRGRLVVPGTATGFGESVHRPAPDPPIYREMLRQWASSGRTLPGRRDQEWTRLTAAPAWTLQGEVSGSRGRAGDGR
ncbi:hypothetical protein GCM10023237_57420 [Streptomyces coeruleoprunus]